MKMSQLVRPFEIDVVVESNGDQTELSQDKVDALMHELEELAKDDSRDFPSALAMVHEAYRICDIERPAPSMRGGWSQYEACMAAAVQYLNKHKPDGQWRVTNSTSK
jgi:hypothetical protein